jgi:hypothetical protein
VTGACIPTGNSEVLLASLYKSPGHAWIYAVITELLSVRRKSVLAGDLNAKHPLWNSAVPNPSGERIMALFDLSEFENSAPQCPTHYSSAGNGDLVDILVHQNIRLLNVMVSDSLDSVHLPIIFHILEHVKVGILSDPIEQFTDWDQFQSLASELIRPRIEINSEVEADKVGRDSTASIASAYKLATSKVTVSDINNDIPGLDRILNYKPRQKKIGRKLGIQRIKRQFIGSRNQSNE